MATSIRNLAAVAIAFPPSCRHLRLYSCESRQNQRSAEKLLYRYVAARSSTRRLPFTPALRWHPAILGYIVPKISRSINRVLHPGRNIPQQSCMSLRAFAFWGAPSLVFRHGLPPVAQFVAQPGLQCVDPERPGQTRAVIMRIVARVKHCCHHEARRLGRGICGFLFPHLPMWLAPRPTVWAGGSAVAFSRAPSLVFRHGYHLLRSLSLSPACSVLIQSVLAKRGLSS